MAMVVGVGTVTIVDVEGAEMGGGGGRGPSGIPYGYTREVDSYYPY